MCKLPFSARVSEEVTVKYLLAIVLPPVAVLLCGTPGAALLNCLLTLCFWIPGVIHALLVVSESKANARAKKYGTR